MAQLHLWLILLLVIVGASCCSSTSSHSNRASGTATTPSSDHSLMKVDLVSANRGGGAVRGQVSSSSYRTSIFAGSGQFISSLSIGTPPVSFTAIVDTGSDLVWRQCLPCTQCYPQADGGATIFDPSKSSTYTKAACKDPLCTEAADTYGGTCDGTCKYTSLYDDPPAYTRGDLSYDTLTISSVSGELSRFPRFAFGCSHESHGPYNFAGSGGIIGLGQGPLSLRAQLNVLKFSYCLRSITDSSPSPLFLGPEASLLLRGAHDVQSTPILYNTTTVYNVQLQGISVGGKKLSISPRIFHDGGAIVDSGTTFTTLAPPAFNAVLKAFRSRISLPRAHGSSPRNLTLCYQSSGPVPSLAFHFQGANLYLPSQNYFITIDGLFCLAILESSDDQSVFGNVQQQNYHILYDLEARLISFKPTACHALLK